MADDIQGQETDTDVQDQDQGSEEDYSLAGGFLEGVPEEHRHIIEPYVKKWDAGVTRRFQELQGRYKPYEELGDYESLQRAAYIANLLDTEPQRVYEALKANLGIAESQNADDQQEEAPGLPKEYVERLENYEKQLNAVAQYILQLHEAEQTSKEDQELDSYLNLLKDEFGDFDEEYVLTKMYNGASGEEAVRAYQKLVQKQINEAGRAEGPPRLPTLTARGGAALPSDQAQSVTSLSRSETKDLVANVLRNLAAQDQ